MQRVTRIRDLIVVSAVIFLGAFLQLLLKGNQLGVLLTSWKWQAGIMGSAALLLLHGYMLKVVGNGQGDGFLAGLDAIRDRMRPFGWLNLLPVGLSVLVFISLLSSMFQEQLQYFYLRLVLLWLLSIVSGVFLSSIKRIFSLEAAIGLSALFLVAGLRIFMFLPEISTYPFSLGWSEASRYYYASLLFSKSIYGEVLPLSPWHPSRYMLQSLPFLLPSNPLWFHRLWQVVLWIGLTLLGSGLLTRRLNIDRTSTRWLITVWAFSYLLIGPVYYHLMVCVIIIFWGVDASRTWRTLVIVVMASLWAGVSRFNWIPVPAFLASTIYLLETPRKEGRRIGAYLFPCLVWIIAGSLSALLAQSGYALLSGNDLRAFGSSLTSALLWERLLPNPTFSFGVLSGILLITLPILLLLAGHFATWRKSIHPFRLYGILASLAILLGGGLVVSVKIGGGGNLHNMDAFIVLLIVIGSYIYFGKIHPPSNPPISPVKAWHYGIAILAVPVLWWLHDYSPKIPQDLQTAQEAFEELKTKVLESADIGGEILFVSERHLLALGEIAPVPLVSEYEKIFLMEMSMAGNREYLDRFYSDIRAHRFSLIISSTLPVIQRGPEHEFGVEDDVWVNTITIPLLEDYQPTLRLNQGRIWVLEPITSSSE